MNSEILKEWCADGRAGPDLHQATGHELRTDPLIELADGENKAALLVKECGRPGQMEGMVAHSKYGSRFAKESVGSAQGERAAAGAVGIEQIKYTLSLDLGSHGNLGGVEVGKAGADPFGPGDDAADAGSNVVGTLVADDLKGHAGHCLA